MATRYLIGAGLALAALFLVLAIGGAQASACAPRSELVAHLAAKFGEVRVSIGVTKKGALIETFASQAGTWTILVTSPTGRSCLVAVGDGFVGSTGTPMLSPKVVPGAERGS
jgi:hypothetical protein